jgi:hypothetical protein
MSFFWRLRCTPHCAWIRNLQRELRITGIPFEFLLIFSALTVTNGLIHPWKLPRYRCFPTQLQS